MRKKPNQAWNYYQWDPTAFILDNRIRKLDGPVIAILRVIHDAMWKSGEQRIIDDISVITAEIDIPASQMEGPLDCLLKSKALYSQDGFLRSPHIDACWAHCQYISKTKRDNRLQGIDKQKKTNSR